MYEETKHITSRLQVLEFLMTQANLVELFRHTDVLICVMYARNVAQGVITQYNRMSESLNISFYVSFPFDEWLRKIQNWKEKLTKPEFMSEHESTIGRKRATRLRLLINKLSNFDAEIKPDTELEDPFKSIADKPYHETIEDLVATLDSLKTNLSNLAMLPLKMSKESRSKALRDYLDGARAKESVKNELQEYVYYCSNKRNTTVIRQLLYLKQRIQALVGKDELSDLDLSESEQTDLLSDLRNIFEEGEINPAPKQIPAKAKPRANDELLSKVANFINMNCGQRFPVLDEDNIVEFLVRKDVTLSDGEEEHLQMLFVLMEEMCQQLEITLRNRPERVAAYSSEFKQRINRVLLKVKAYNARLLPCMDKGKTVADLNGLFERWFSPSLDPTLRPNQEELLKLLEDGYDKIKMEAYVHLLREASSLSLFKKAKPMSNKLYMALATVNGVPDEEFPISGVSFNKYFRNPDFCKEAKWLEAAKVLTAVHQEFITGTQTFGH